MIEHFARPANFGTFDAVVRFHGRIVHVEDSFPRLLDAVEVAAQAAKDPQNWNAANAGQIAQACHGVNQ